MTDISLWLDTWATVMWKACWQGGLVALAAWLICRVIPSMPARLQCWLWRFAILKFLLVLMLPSLVDVPWFSPPSVATSQPESQIAILTPASPMDQDRHSTVERSRLHFVLLILWITGFLWSVGRIVTAWRETKRLRVSGCSCRCPLVIEQLNVLCGLFRLKTIPKCLVVAGSGSPMLIGTLRPAVVLPVETLHRLSADELLLVFGHELAHVRRGDLLWSFVAACVRAVFFFHPLVWLGQRRLNLSQETAADAMAIAQQQYDPIGYGKLLVSVVGKLDSARVIPMMSMGAAGPLESLTRRLVAMRFVGTTSRRVCFTSVLMLSAVVSLGLVPWRLVAAEPKAKDKPVAVKPAADPVRYFAKIKFLRVAQKGTETTTINTEVTGTKGTLLKTALGGKNGVIVKLEMSAAD